MAEHFGIKIETKALEQRLGDFADKLQLITLLLESIQRELRQTRRPSGDLTGTGSCYCPKCKVTVLVQDSDGWHCPGCRVAYVAKDVGDIGYP